MSAENIKLIYLKNKSKSSSNVITPLFFIVLVGYVFVYLYTNIQKKLLNINWDENKCNPRYMFFSGFLNPLDKNPWYTTQTNFQKCVASNIYKDPKLTKEIKTNDALIHKNMTEISKTMDKGKKIINEIKTKWDIELEEKQQDINRVKLQNDKIYNEQGYLYEEVAKQATQLFNVLYSIITFVRGNLILRVSDHKEKLSIQTVHEGYMKDYIAANKKYNDCYDSLNAGTWIDAINKANDAIKTYNSMTNKIDNFISDNMTKADSITESCYQLKYNLNNNTCNTIFPNLNNTFVDIYPIIPKIFK